MFSEKRRTKKWAIHHTYQILTKRHKRLLELAPELDWSDNIWMGVSAESPPSMVINQKMQATPKSLK